MATISKEALQWLQDELETKEGIIDSLEDELSAALQDVESLKARILQLMSDRSMGV